MGPATALDTAFPWNRHKTGSRSRKNRHIPILPGLMGILRSLESWPHRHERYVFAT